MSHVQKPIGSLVCSSWSAPLCLCTPCWHLTCAAFPCRVTPRPSYHVRFEDQVVLGDAEVTSDILPILNPLLLWLINSLSALGVPFLPLLLGRILKSKLADGTPRGSLGAEKDEEEGEEVAGYMAGPLSRLRINPQDIALLEQQTGRREREQKLQVSMAGCWLLSTVGHRAVPVCVLYVVTGSITGCMQHAGSPGTSFPA